MTKAESEYLEDIASFGCICCLKLGADFVAGEIHHLRRNPNDGKHLGMSQRAPHRWAICLCPMHHRSGKKGVAYHAGPRSWAFDEVELWRETQDLIYKVDRWEANMKTDLAEVNQDGILSV